MTLGGALSELGNLLKADDIPVYYKTSIKAVMDTITLSSSENPSRWIPVSERLPEEAGMYLCSYDDDDVGTSYFDIRMNEFNILHEQVTAWMPLPKSYKP